MSDKNPLEVVRIKDPSTGLERNATRAHAKNIKATVLEGADVVDKHGRPRPASPDRSKLRTDLAGQPVVTERSTHEEIDEHARQLGVDLAGATTKSDKLAAIDAAADTQES